MNELYELLKEKVITGNQAETKEILQKLLDAGEPAKQIIDMSLVPAMDIVGDKFQKNEFFIPELLVSARAMEGCMKILQPLLVAGDVQPTGVFMIGTAKGDLHDIGKNIVAAMMKGAGFEIIDLGIDVAPEKFVQAISEKKPDVVGLSALLTTTMRAMKETIEEMKKKGVRDHVKVIVGGAPLTQAYADEIGADAYGRDAADAVKIAKALIGK
jgi:5-methyltetrahydrofolate--homocysteine methyltransferase